MPNHIRAAVILSTIALLAHAPPARADVKEDLASADKKFDEGKLAKAAKDYDRAINSAPKQVPPEAYGKRASIYYLLAAQATKDNKPDVAKGLLEDGLSFITDKAESVYPNAPEVLAQKALILWDLKSKPDAIKAAEAAVEKNPTIYAVQRIIGEYHAVRDPARSIKAYEAYLAHRPNTLAEGDVLPRVQLGFAYLGQVRKLGQDRKVPEAKQASQKALAQFETLMQKHRTARHAEVNASNGLCTTYAALAQIEESEGNKQTKMWDRAITSCERIIENAKAIDRGGSVYYNVGKAYLAKRQSRKARTVGQEYIRMRKSEPRGYILVGDSYAQERNWTGALEWYQKAEDTAKSSKEYAADIGIKMGVAFIGAKQPDRAIEKLKVALQNDTKNVVIMSELGRAYLSNKQDDEALATVRKAIAADEFAKLQPDEQVLLLTVAGKAAYNQAEAKKDGAGSADEARTHFEAAHKLNPRDTAVRTGLVKTLTLQAYQSYKKKNVKQAEASLRAALDYDKKNPAANQDMAALTIAAGNCDEAKPYVAALENERSYAMMYHRLSGRLALCGSARDVKKAIEHFAAADKVTQSNNLVRAEIYTEWGPLIWDKDLDEAVEKLETAVQFTAQTPSLNKPAQRALALALFRRGWRTMRGGKKVADPVDDFQRASRDPSVLKGTEKHAFEFSEALARLDRGDSAGAAKLFDSLAKAGNQGAYLKAPYDRVGAQFFGAYAKYRSGNAAQLKQAAAEFQALLAGAKGNFGEKVRDLLGSTYEQLAYDAIEGNNTKTASAHLDAAAKYAGSAAAKRRIAHNRAVMRMGGKPSKELLTTFTNMGSDPPEALVNRGIMLDREGNPRAAYEAWQKAKAAGARGGKVSDWIATKKRIFGYP